MRRRDFITLLGGAAAWPVVAHAQRPDRMRRVGVLTAGSNPLGQASIAVFLQELNRLVLASGSYDSAARGGTVH
jgi:putative ABC transport system substrate-binding protein